MTNRDYRYYALAQYVARWSKDPSTKVGAVLVGVDQRRIALGYNGFPPGVADDDRLHDRPEKYRLTMHAERNVLDNAAFDVVGATLYCTQFPCCECAKSIVSKGLRRVIAPDFSGLREPWRSDAGHALALLREVMIGVEFVPQNAAEETTCPHGRGL